MTAYEKLGVFYLGKAFDMESGKLREEMVLYDSKDLTTHAVIIGITGSGKTGLGIGLIEETLFQFFQTTASAYPSLGKGGGVVRSGYQKAAWGEADAVLYSETGGSSHCQCGLRPMGQAPKPEKTQPELLARLMGQGSASRSDPIRNPAPRSPCLKKVKMTIAMTDRMQAHARGQQ